MPEELTLLDSCWENRHLSGEIHQMNNRLIALIVICLGALTGAHSLAQDKPTPEEILESWLASAHADSTTESFRHWDTEGEIPGTCAVCHSTTGIVDYLATPPVTAGVIPHSVAIGTTVECAACHNDNAAALESVLFPNGQMVSIANSSAICTVCHQGRNSMDQVDASVASIGDDEVSPAIPFVNIHYAAAASTQLGATVRGGYQYEGRSYAGPFGHVAGFETCVSCHGAHDTEVKLESCTTCHAGAADFRAIRTTPPDVLGDGNTSAGIATVIDQLHSQLEVAIRTYATEVGGGNIAYSKTAFPYFFNDLNGNGSADPEEAVFPNAYKSWTPRLLRAAYNYQFVAKDGGAFAHNPHYVIQLMIDSIEDLASVAAIDKPAYMRP
ncbi:MAG: polyheme membrane-associated cytochrome C [Paracoccaceae bacterium]